jgi:hypothetical protein
MGMGAWDPEKQCAVGSWLSVENGAGFTSSAPFAGAFFSYNCVVVYENYLPDRKVCQ